jgi:hypothetical protein
MLGGRCSPPPQPTGLWRAASLDQPVTKLQKRTLIAFRRAVHRVHSAREPHGRPPRYDVQCKHTTLQPQRPAAREPQKARPGLLTTPQTRPASHGRTSLSSLTYHSHSRTKASGQTAPQASRGPVTLSSHSIHGQALVEMLLKRACCDPCGDGLTSARQMGHVLSRSSHSETHSSQKMCEHSITTGFSYLWEHHHRRHHHHRHDHHHLFTFISLPPPPTTTE